MNEKLELLVNAKNYIPDILIKLDEIIKCFRNGDEAKGSILSGQIIDNLEKEIQILSYTADVQKEKVDFLELNDALKEIIEGFENEDFILIADLFQYEIKPVLEKWSGLIETSIN